MPELSDVKKLQFIVKNLNINLSKQTSVRVLLVQTLRVTYKVILCIGQKRSLRLSLVSTNV